MIKSKGRRITWFILTLILAMGMVGTSVLAANSTDSSNNQFGKNDSKTNTTVDTTTAQRMANSNNIGKVTMHKQFDKIDGKWPTDMSFKYDFTRVKWWDNSNVSTQENGTWKGGDLTAMPLPDGEGVADKQGDDNTKVLTITTVAQGEVAIGKALKNLTFTRPGYYVYRVVEQYTDPNPKNGIKYDEHVYYLAFYVANRTETAEYVEVTGAQAKQSPDGIYFKTRSGDAATGYTYAEPVTGEAALKALADDAVLYKKSYNENGITIGGGKASESDDIYVHTITAWRGNATSGTNAQTGDNLPTEISPADVDPAFNNASGDDKDKANNENNVGKVGRSTPEKPNCIEIKFWNETDSKNITLEKVVKGTLGDVQKEFEFTVVIKGAEKNAEYAITGNGNLEKVQSGDVGTVTVASDQTPVTAKMTTDENGDCTFTVRLKGGQYIDIEGLSTGATYQVTEAASDHRPEYNIEGAGTFTYNKTTSEPAEGEKVYYYDTEGKKWIGVSKLADVPEGKDAYSRKHNGAVVVTATDKKDGKNNALTTAEETVNATDGAVKITYTNTRDFETETGIPNFVFPVVLAAMLALIGLAVVRRRNSVSSVNDFEF